jgi:hypothetical protein
MKYEKPELVALGSALDSVQGTNKPAPTGFDAEYDSHTMTATAYEADE